MAECANITLDRANSLLKIVWNGKPSYTDVQDILKEVAGEISKYKKGELLLLIDTSNLDIRFLPPGAEKILTESYNFTNEFCKKTANVISSLMMEKQLDKTSSADSVTNLKVFDNEQEAMKWLLEK